MSDLFKDKYRTTSTRLPGWDYGSNAYYFVTIRARNRIEYFGDVLRDNSNAYGWPHGTHGRDVACNVSTGPHVTGIDIKHASSDERKQWMSDISPAPSSLPTIIRSFKSAATKQCHEFEYNFQWQSRYYDRIIRNEQTLYAVRRYTKTTPDRWQRNRNNSENIWV